MKYKAQVNNHFEIDLPLDIIQNLDLVKENDHNFHVLHNGASFKVAVENVDYREKTFVLQVNGRSYNLKLDDEYDQLVHKLGLEIVSGAKLKDVKAPMPGLVINISVDIGQEITKGDTLLILEAMKMENIIKADGDGVVKSILINKGLAVEKGQLLIEMED